MLYRVSSLCLSVGAATRPSRSPLNGGPRDPSRSGPSLGGSSALPPVCPQLSPGCESVSVNQSKSPFLLGIRIPGEGFHSVHFSARPHKQRRLNSGRYAYRAALSSLQSQPARVSWPVTPPGDSRGTTPTRLPPVTPRILPWVGGASGGVFSNMGEPSGRERSQL